MKIKQRIYIYPIERKLIVYDLNDLIQSIVRAAISPVFHHLSSDFSTPPFSILSGGV